MLCSWIKLLATSVGVLLASGCASTFPKEFKLKGVHVVDSSKIDFDKLRKTDPASKTFWGKFTLASLDDLKPQGKLIEVRVSTSGENIYEYVQPRGTIAEIVADFCNDEYKILFEYQTLFTFSSTEYRFYIDPKNFNRFESMTWGGIKRIPGGGGYNILEKPTDICIAVSDSRTFGGFKSPEIRITKEMLVEAIEKQ